MKLQKYAAIFRPLKVARFLFAAKGIKKLLFLYTNQWLKPEQKFIEAAAKKGVEMKTIKRFALIITFLILAGTYAFAQIPDEVVSSIRAGNAAKLSKYFNQNVELLVLDFECSCSKSQAQQVVNDFFAKYPPSKFTIIHQGGKNESNYAIGTLETPKGKLRVYFLVKTINQVSFIHQLRIEAQSD